MLLSAECRVKGLPDLVDQSKRAANITNLSNFNPFQCGLHMVTYVYIWLQYIIFLLDPKGWGPVISWFQTPSKYSYSNLLVSNPISFPTPVTNWGPKSDLSLRRLFVAAPLVPSWRSGSSKRGLRAEPCRAAAPTLRGRKLGPTL